MAIVPRARTATRIVSAFYSWLREVGPSLFIYLRGICFLSDISPGSQAKLQRERNNPSPVMFKVELFTMASAFMNFQENIEKVGMPVD